MPERPSLAERKVLVTRAPDRARAWIEALSARGATVVARETFRLESTADGPEARAALDGLGRYGWVLLTSGNGLRFFCDALEARGRALADLEVRFGVVGPQTAAALRVRGVEPSVEASRADSGGLADELVGRVGAGERVLVVRPEVTRPALVAHLASAGIAVDAVPFYRNRPAERVEEVAAELARGGFHAAVFGSPSAFIHLIEASGAAAAALAGVALVAIGETTAAAIRERDREVAGVAHRPTPEGIADAVERALGR